MKYVNSKTERGFDLVQFRDDYNELCDIQRSSATEESMIWLGIHDLKPKILDSKTAEGGTGWVDYPLPEGVLTNQRMHLTRKQAISLAFKLLIFGLFDKLNQKGDNYV